MIATVAMSVGMLIALSPGSASAASSTSAVTCKIKGKKVTCPTSKLRGPRGPRGPQGPAGIGGAVSVRNFSFLAVGNQSNTTLATFGGVVAEASCTGGILSQARLRSTADNGSAQVVNAKTDTQAFDASLDTGQSVTLRPGNTDDLYTFAYMSANGATVATATYAAHDGAGIGGQFDCAIYGTLQVN